MKIREVRVQNLRNFGADASVVSFVDAATGQVRPLTVLVGSNGSGKTTVLDLIEGAYRAGCEEIDADDPRSMTSIIRERQGARVVADFQVPGAVNGVEATEPWRLEFEARPGETVEIHPAREDGLRVFRAVANLGALVYFPTERHLGKARSSATISRPNDTSSYVYRYKPLDQYEGSLEQLWVWQNYLDLEAQKDGHPNLLPFVETIQTILGREQRLTIHRGEVWIERPHLGDRVRIHELPSGEKQVLLIFGEIVRRLRPQAIVMIDELEMSLHPALQRVVLHHLRRLARQHDLQVIVTTHSMEIVADADVAEVVNLDDMAFVEQAVRSSWDGR